MEHDGRYSLGRPRFYNCHGGHSQTWVQVESSKQIQTETGKCPMSDQYWHDVLTLEYCKEEQWVEIWVFDLQGSVFGGPGGEQFVALCLVYSEFESAVYI